VPKIKLSERQNYISGIGLRCNRLFISKRSHRLVSEDKVNVATKSKHVINKLFKNEAKRNACALAKKSGKKIT
jgi:hypothetical protein